MYEFPVLIDIGHIILEEVFIKMTSPKRFKLHIPLISFCFLQTILK
jgi:hypothetical protein